MEQIVNSQVPVFFYLHTHLQENRCSVQCLMFLELKRTEHSPFVLDFD